MHGIAELVPTTNQPHSLTCCSQLQSSSAFSFDVHFAARGEGCPLLTCECSVPPPHIPVCSDRVSSAQLTTIYKILLLFLINSSALGHLSTTGGPCETEQGKSSPSQPLSFPKFLSGHVVDVSAPLQGGNGTGFGVDGSRLSDLVW